MPFFNNFGPTELIIILVIGIVFFGRRLPEVGKSLGKSIVEFKKGLRGIEDDIEVGSTDRSRRETERVEGDEPTFDVPPEPAKKG